MSFPDILIINIYFLCATCFLAGVGKMPVFVMTASSTIINSVKSVICKICCNILNNLSRKYKFSNLILQFSFKCSTPM